jgi:hypothetical protein
MTRLSERALEECVAELRAACRRPIDDAALTTLLDWIRPVFGEILDRPDGNTYWSDCGQHMRNNGRYVGGLADFISHQADVDVVGASELMQAFTMVRDACRVGAEGSRLERT